MWHHLQRKSTIPENLQKDILNQLHQGHMGIERTRRLARASVYWPNINHDIERIVKVCEICQQYQPQKQQEPLIPHDIPSTPWRKLASDIFSIGHEDFLVVVDYHSKYQIVRKLRNTMRNSSGVKNGSGTNWASSPSRASRWRAEW